MAESSASTPNPYESPRAACSVNREPIPPRKYLVTALLAYVSAVLGTLIGQYMVPPRNFAYDLTFKMIGLALTMGSTYLAIHAVRTKRWLLLLASLPALVVALICFMIAAGELYD